MKLFHMWPISGAGSNLNSTMSNDELAAHCCSVIAKEGKLKEPLSVSPEKVWDNFTISTHLGVQVLN